MIATVRSALVAMPPLGAAVVSGVSVAVGLALFPLISKISQIAVSAFKSLGDWFKEGALPLRIRSMSCSECAKNHKQHISHVPTAMKVPSALKPPPAPIFEQQVKV